MSTTRTVVRLPDHRYTIEGTLAEISEAVESARIAGRLQTCSTPTQVGTTGRYVVHVQLRPPPRSPVEAHVIARRRHWRVGAWIAFAAACLVAAALIAFLVAFIAAHAALFLTLALAGLLVSGWAATRSRGRAFSGTFQGKIH